MFTDRRRHTPPNTELTETEFLVYKKIYREEKVKEIKSQRKLF
jgi:hypothetical protein